MHARAWLGWRGEQAALQRAGKERGKEGEGKEEKKMEKGKGKRKKKKKKKRRERERERKRERERERAHVGGIRGRRSRVGDRQPSSAERDGGKL